MRRSKTQKIDNAREALSRAQDAYDTAQRILKRATDASERARAALDSADREHEEIMRGIPEPRAIERRTPSPSESEEGEPPRKRRVASGTETTRSPPYDYTHAGWHTVPRKYRKIYDRVRRPGWQGGDPGFDEDFDEETRYQPVTKGETGAQNPPPRPAGRPSMTVEAEEEEEPYSAAPYQTAAPQGDGSRFDPVVLEE